MTITLLHCCQLWMLNMNIQMPKGSCAMKRKLLLLTMISNFLVIHIQCPISSNHFFSNFHLELMLLHLFCFVVADLMPCFWSVDMCSASTDAIFIMTLLTVYYIILCCVLSTLYVYPTSMRDIVKNSAPVLHSCPVSCLHKFPWQLLLLTTVPVKGRMKY